MGRGDEANIVTVQLVLEIYHLLCQGAKVHLPRILVLWVLAYLEILAIGTSHIAITEKYGSGALTA